MLKFTTPKKIHNPKKSTLKQDNHGLIKLIKEGYTTTELIEKGYKRRRISRWQRKIPS